MGEGSFYVHGTEPEEQERLTALNDMMNQASVSELRLEPREKVLDVGFGPRPADARDGAPHGSARGRRGAEHGADRRSDAPGARREGRTSRRHPLRRRREPPSRRRRVGDVRRRAHPLLARARPQSARSRAVDGARLRPGGRIVLEDDDHDLLRLWPEPPGVMPIWNAYMRSYDRAGNDPIVGRRLVQLLHRAGAEPRRNTWLFFGSCSGGPNFTGFVRNLASILRGARAAIVATGFSDDAIHRAVDALWRVGAATRRRLLVRDRVGRRRAAASLKRHPASLDTSGRDLHGDRRMKRFIFAGSLFVFLASHGCSSDSPARTTSSGSGGAGGASTVSGGGGTRDRRNPSTTSTTASTTSGGGSGGVGSGTAGGAGTSTDAAGGAGGSGPAGAGGGAGTTTISTQARTPVAPRARRERERWTSGPSPILDKKTCLVWEKASSGNMTNKQAAKYCDQLVQDGISDWRVAAPEELATWPNLAANGNAYVTNPIYIPTNSAERPRRCTGNAHSCNSRSTTPDRSTVRGKASRLSGPAVCVRGTALPGTTASMYAATNCAACSANVTGAMATFKIANCLPFAN